jgi:hypothetical protein
VARMGEERKCTSFSWERPKERHYSEDRGVDGRMGSKWILRRLAGGRVDPVGSVHGPVTGSCKYVDKSAGSGATVLDE